MTSSTSTNGGTGLSSSLTPVDSSQLTPISLSAASYARLEQLIQNGTAVLDLHRAALIQRLKLA